MHYIIVAIITTFIAATLTACGPHIAHPPHRPSERHNPPALILPMASPDGPAVSSGGQD